ncbi:MAG: hypothetical protein ACFE95_19145 [Candidatus Hodarchaeota archaeon]
MILDGREIHLQRFSFYDQTGEKAGLPGTHWWVFYKTFESNYFAPGNHDLTVIFSARRLYEEKLATMTIL